VVPLLLRIQPGNTHLQQLVTDDIVVLCIVNMYASSSALRGWVLHSLIKDGPFLFLQLMRDYQQDICVVEETIRKFSLS
jgi:hypothetical protein